MPRSIDGHGRVKVKYPPPSSTFLPWSSTTSAARPGNGDVAEGRDLGDTTTLADAAVVDEIKRRAAVSPTEE